MRYLITVIGFSMSLNYSLAQDNCIVYEKMAYYLNERFNSRDIYMSEDKDSFVISNKQFALLKKRGYKGPKVSLENFSSNQCLNRYTHMSVSNFRELKIDYKFSKEDSRVNDSLEKLIVYRTNDNDEKIAEIQKILSSNIYQRLDSIKSQQTPVFVFIFSSPYLQSDFSRNFFISISSSQNVQSDNMLSYLVFFKKVRGQWIMKLEQYWENG